MRPLTVILLLLLVSISLAWKPRYWKLDSHGRWKTSRWSTSEERYAVAYNMGRLSNVAPGYYNNYYGNYGTPTGGYWGRKK